MVRVGVKVCGLLESRNAGATLLGKDVKGSFEEKPRARGAAALQQTFQCPRSSPGMHQAIAVPGCCYLASPTRQIVRSIA